MIRTRIPGLDDKPLLRLIRTRLVPEARRARPHIRFHKQEVLRRLDECHVLVATASPGAKPQGFISFTLDRDTLIIDMLAVDRKCEGQGVGSRLMMEAEAIGRLHGMAYAKLAVDEPNWKARSFYARRGYEIAQYEPKYRMYWLIKYLQ